MITTTGRNNNKKKTTTDSYSELENRADDGYGGAC